MDSEHDLSSMSARIEEALEAELPPGLVHAKRSPGARPGWTELSFPSGLVCTTNSIPGETEYLYNEIFENRVYLPSGITVADGETILDVGANIGMFAMFIVWNFDHMTVHSIEPVPANFEVLQKNLERYPHHDVHLHNIALGAEADELVDIIHYPHLTGNSTVHPETGEVQREWFSSVLSSEEFEYLYEKEKITVPSTTLSELMRREGIEAIDLLKLDAEGSELDIFRGIESDDWSRIKQLAMEVHDADNLLPQVIEALASCGMKPSIDESTRDPAADIIVTATHG